MGNIVLGKINVEKKTRKNKDGTKTPYSHICITLRNKGDAAVVQEVTFYRLLIPPGGAKPSTPAPPTRLCTAGPKPVPAKRVVPHGESDGDAEFCCDVDDMEEDDSALGTIQIHAEVGAPPTPAGPLDFNKGDDHAVLDLK